MIYMVLFLGLMIFGAMFYAVYRIGKTTHSFDEQ